MFLEFKCKYIAANVLSELNKTYLKSTPISRPKFMPSFLNNSCSDKINVFYFSLSKLKINNYIVFIVNIFKYNIVQYSPGHEVKEKK